MSPSLTLAECLCARVCHDLSNPLSALSGVLDLIRHSPNNDEAASIAHQAVRATQDRLRLFRAAWCPTDEPMDASEIRALTEGLDTGRRVILNLQALSGSFPPDFARLILNLLLVAVESLGGIGTVDASGSARKGVTIGISGSRAHWPESLATYLNEPPQAWAGLDPQNLMTPFAAILATSTHRTVTLHPLDGGRQDVHIVGDAKR